MDEFTLTDKNFCKLFKSIHLGKDATHIKIKGHGNSMTPFLQTGDVLFIRPVDFTGTVKIGDIIAVTDKKEEKIIVHRVINIKNDLFQIKGDNCKNHDGWFQKNRIIGIVTCKEKISGKFISFKRWENLLMAFLSKTGFLNTILLPLGRLFKKKMQRP